MLISAEDSLKLLSGLNEEQNHELYQFLLSWALCCGNLNASIPASQLIIHLGYRLSKEDALAAGRSLSVVTNLLTERSQVTKSKKHKNLLKVINDDKCEPEWNNTYLYLSNLLLLIQTADPAPELFFAPASLLRCSSNDHSLIFSTAAQVVSNFFESRESVSAIQVPETFPGLIPYLFLSNLDNSTLLIIAHILQNGLLFNVPSLLLSSPRALEIALYGLLPFISSEDSFLKKLQDLPLVKDVLSQHGDILLNFHLNLSKNFNQDDSEMILLFFASITHSGTPKQATAAFLLSGMIVGSCKTKEVSPALAKLSKEATIRKELTVTQAAKVFLKQTMLKCSGLVLIPSTPPSKTFPDIKDLWPYKLDFETINENDVDPFLNSKNFPPVYLTDFGFLSCDSLMNVKIETEKVHAFPFTQWDDTLFRAQPTNVNMDLDDSCRDELDIKKEIKDESELKKIAEQNGDFTRVSYGQTSKISIGVNDGPDQDYISDLCIVDPALFCPCLADIDALCSNTC